MRGQSVLVPRRVPLPPQEDATASLPLAEDDLDLSSKPDWQPLSSAMLPHKAGVYWLGLRQGSKVTALYHGMASYLDERIGGHRKALEGRGTDVPAVHWGIVLAAVVGTVVVRWEETGRYQTAEARELRSRNYALNSAKNEGYRVKAGLLAVGISTTEVDAIWVK